MRTTNFSLQHLLMFVTLAVAICALCRYGYDRYAVERLSTAVARLNDHACNDVLRPEFTITENEVVNAIVTQLNDLHGLERLSSTDSQSIQSMLERIATAHEMPRSASLELHPGGVISLKITSGRSDYSLFIRHPGLEMVSPGRMRFKDDWDDFAGRAHFSWNGNSWETTQREKTNEPSDAPLLPTAVKPP